jgi:hypothetical protein
MEMDRRERGRMVRISQRYSLYDAMDRAGGRLGKWFGK